MIKYKYFQNPLKYADFIDKPCGKCGSNKNCLDTVYFNYSSDDIESVCLECLDQGNALVKIPSYIYERITNEVTKHLDGSSEEDIKVRINSIIKELERTPPIPWIQNDDWKMCCGDIMNYLGEWNQEKLNNMSKNQDGKQYLASILSEDTKVDVADIWDDISNDVVIFVFKSLHCGQIIATWQCF